MQVRSRKNDHRFFVHNLFAVLTSICGFSTVPLQVHILVGRGRSRGGSGVGSGVTVIR